jgi:AcrR family transcriptional regulator
MTTSTPDRLLDAARDLFAEHGFAGTSVGDVEEAAGFTRRGGTVYKHFRSKEELFKAVIDRHASSVSQAGDLADLLPLGDLDTELSLVARFVLAELATVRQIHQALECGGRHVPAAQERMLNDVVEPGYRRSSALLQRWVGENLPVDDVEAVTSVLVGGLINLRRNLWTFGRVPLDVNDDRAVAAWVQIARAFIVARQRP